MKIRRGHASTEIRISLRGKPWRPRTPRMSRIYGNCLKIPCILPVLSRMRQSSHLGSKSKQTNRGLLSWTCASVVNTASRPVRHKAVQTYMQGATPYTTQEASAAILCAEIRKLSQLREPREKLQNIPSACPALLHTIASTCSLSAPSRSWPNPWSLFSRRNMAT